MKGDPDSAKTIQAIAWEAFTSHDLPDGTDPNLFGESTVDPQVFSYPHGTHLCAVEVDTETGMTKIRKYVAVDDVGVQVNPMIVEGQIHGGITQGIAQALWEGASYDEDGNLVTASLADYLLPTAVDVPFYDTDRTVTPSTTHPLGTKGVGEAGAIASTPAVINAIVDAVRHARGDRCADAGHAGSGLAGDPSHRRRWWLGRHAAADAAAPRPETEVRDDPGPVRLRPADLGARMRSRRSPRPATTPR